MKNILHILQNLYEDNNQDISSLKYYSMVCEQYLILQNLYEDNNQDIYSLKY